MKSNDKHEISLVQILTEDREKSMKTNFQDKQNLLLILTGRGLKYFVLTLAAFAIAIVVFQIFGVSALTEALLSVAVWIWFLRVAALLFSLFAIGMIFESCR